MSPDLSRAIWRKSIRSQQGANCVELAGLPGVVAVRDSKDPHGSALIFSLQAATRLLETVKAGAFDL